MRLDIYLVEHGFCTTRAKAQDAIASSRVQVSGKTITKNSFAVDENSTVTMIQEDLAFASRAGFKLYDVLDDFGITLQDRICIDVGASTGGFSDVCLKLGAAKVYAVDVGRDQLLEELKCDPRIVNMEGVNCRYLTAEPFDPLPDFACMDVSFISVKLILPTLMEIFSGIELVVLIKPQFEAGKAHIGKNGIVKDLKVHVQVLQDMISFVEGQGYYVHHLQPSSVVGRDGNQEYVMHIRNTPVHKVFPLRELVKNHKSKR